MVGLFAREINDMFGFKINKGFAVDVIETKEGFKVMADLPGYSKENIKLNFEDGVLTISASALKEEENLKYLVRERYLGEQVRKLYLDDVNPETITAKFIDGVLTISLSKNESKNKNIEIE